MAPPTTRLGASLTYTDALGQVSRVERNALGDVLRMVFADATSVSFEYDAARRPIRLTDPLGAQMQFTYDASGNRTEIVDPTGATARLSYDALDRAIALTDPLGGTWRRTFDAEGRVLEEIDPENHATHFTYDARGLLESIMDRVGNTTRLIYDAAGQRVEVVDEAGAITRQEYDRVGRLIAQTNPLGGRDQWLVTAGGRLSALVDALNRRLSFDYDEAGRLVGASDPVDARIRFVLDPVGNLVSRTDRAGATTTFALDAMNRPVAETDALGNTTRYTFDVTGNLAAIEDPLGHVTRFEHDAADRLTSVLDALGGVTRYAYDTRGALSERLDANGHATRYAYDASGRLTGVTDPLGRSTEAELDALGRPRRTLYADGSSMSATFDPLGRLLQAEGSDGWHVQLDYDASGQTRAMRDALGETRFAFDALGRLESVHDPFGQVTQFAHDAVGNRVSLTYPTGHTASYEYDLRDRLVSLRDWLDGEHHFDYDERGRPTSITFANGMRARATRDALGQVLSLAYFAPDGRALVDFGYAYDALGNVVVEGERAYRYDGLSRLVEADRARFTYDAVGNRVQVELANGTTLRAHHDAADQLVELDGAILEYDARGNLVAEAGQHFEWDVAGRLRGVTLADGTRTSYDYDAAGNLYVERRGASRRQFALDLGAPLLQVLSIVGDGEPVEYAFGPTRIAQIESEPRYYVTDLRGSVRGVTNPAGELMTEQRFDAWGTPVDALEEPFGFTGELQPEEAGLVQLRARWYAPSTGRFLGRDPASGAAGWPMSQHPYAYANANPTTLVDPTGLAAPARALALVNMPMPEAPLPGISPFGGTFPEEGGLPGVGRASWHRIDDRRLARLGAAERALGPGPGPATVFDEFSKQTVEQVADYYKQARSAQAASEQWGVKAAAYFDRAMQPSDSLLWRLPILRDVRAGWIEGGGKYAQSVSDGFKAQANELEGAARDLETSTRWAKPVSKVVNVKTISVLDAAVAGLGSVGRRHREPCGAPAEDHRHGHHGCVPRRDGLRWWSAGCRGVHRDGRWRPARGNLRWHRQLDRRKGRRLHGQVRRRGGELDRERRRRRRTRDR